MVCEHKVVGLALHLIHGLASLLRRLPLAWQVPPFWHVQVRLWVKAGTLHLLLWAGKEYTHGLCARFPKSAWQ